MIVTVLIFATVSFSCTGISFSSDTDVFVDSDVNIDDSGIDREPDSDQEPGVYTGNSKMWTDFDTAYTWSGRSPGQINWDDAVNYCKNIREGGYSDWRLPTIGELRTLIQYCPNTETDGKCSVTDDCLKRTCFNEECSDRKCPQRLDGRYSKLNEFAGLWSSSEADSLRAWYIEFLSAFIYYDYTHDYHSVRCIRVTEGTKRTQSCKGPENILWNTVDEITQTWNGAEWTPSSKGIFDKKSSEAECRYVCIDNAAYNDETQSCDCHSGYKAANEKCLVIANPCDPDPCGGGNNCVAEPVAGNPELYTGHYKCSCYEGYFWTGLTCMKMPEMTIVPAGSFWMGCNESVDNECRDREKPYHEIYMDSYYIDKYEVTADQYQKCVDAGICEAVKTVQGCNSGVSGKENHPINCVSWGNAITFCNWLDKRLPTEAEWEKASRGGCELYKNCKAESRKYPWGNDPVSCDYAVMYDESENGQNCGENGTMPVGSIEAGISPYGIFDMSGNVWEWVNDSYSEIYYENSPESNPSGPEDSYSLVVIRGGSRDQYYQADSLRVSFRTNSTVDSKSISLGFRCAK